MKKIILAALLLFTLCSCDMPAKDKEMSVPEPTQAVETETADVKSEELDEEIDGHENSSADGMTKLKSYSGELLGEDSKITIYTSAAREDDELIWDDMASFLVELEGSDGTFYTLYESPVSNGCVYFDVVECDGEKYVFVKTVASSENYTDVFGFAGGFPQKCNSFDLNKLKNMNTNLLYTSVPFYR